MRVAVISDIHANVVALDAVLADLSGDHPDAIVCLGDLPALNPQPRAVLDRLYALGCPTLRGNVDDRIPRHLSLEPDAAVAFQSMAGQIPHEIARRLRDIEFWCAEQLTDMDKEWLLSRPLTHELALDGATTLLCFHGSPQSNMDLIFPTTADAALDDVLRGLLCARAGRRPHARADAPPLSGPDRRQRR